MLGQLLGSKVVLESTDEQADGAPTLISKIPGFTLGFGGFANRHHTRHASPILNHMGMIA